MKMRPDIGGAQYDDEFVYEPGDRPGWQKIGDLIRRRRFASRLTIPNQVQMPLTLMPFAALPDTLDEVRRRVARLDRTSLIQRYQIAYVDGKRLIAGIMAAELIERGIPPCFWHQMLALDDATLEQRADLVLADLAWLRRWHPQHAENVRYQRGKTLLTGSDADFRRETAFAFYNGKRPAWKLVGSMSMTERQQWESAYLRSTPVKKQAALTEKLSVGVQQVLQDDLQKARRTVAFTDDDAQAALARRYALWRCARMCKDASPTEVAIRYEQMTGVRITRQAAAKQLEKVRIALCAKESTS